MSSSIMRVGRSLKGRVGGKGVGECVGFRKIREGGTSKGAAGGAAIDCCRHMGSDLTKAQVGAQWTMREGTEEHVQYYK